jgi:hypothetical protein
MAIVCYVNKNEFCVQVKNKSCVDCTVIMHLIPWKCSRGSETTMIALNLPPWVHKILQTTGPAYIQFNRFFYKLRNIRYELK